MAELRGSEQDLSQILRSNLFYSLSPEERIYILENCELINLKNGELLFSPEEKAFHFYFLRKGRIIVLKPDESGEESEIAHFAEGDIIGDFDFARGARYDAVAKAGEDSTLIIFPRKNKNTEELAGIIPSVISKILLSCADMVTSRVKETRKLVMEKTSWVEELQRQAHEDPGTGLLKQSFLADEINRILENPSALIMLKPDRFKLLVDTLGHHAGDLMMVKFAGILKDIIRKLGRGWALRFRSNEMGLLINDCDVNLAESIANSLSEAINSMPPISLGQSSPVEINTGEPGQGDLIFTATIVWSIWPLDDHSWNTLFEETYKLLMENWRDNWKKQGNTIVRYQLEQLSEQFTSAGTA